MIILENGKKDDILLKENVEDHQVNVLCED